MSVMGDVTFIGGGNGGGDFGGDSDGEDSDDNVFECTDMFIGGDSCDGDNEV